MQIVPAVKRGRSFLEIVKEYAASEGLKLPVFPDVAFELHQLLAEPDVSIDKVAKVISTDQGLTSQIMKLANSGFYAGLRKVSTIHDVILRLGINTVFNNVLAIKQGNYYKSSDPMLDAFLKVSYKHAICTAAGSQWLVISIGHQRLSNAAYLAGLLHDIGKLLLIKVIDAIKSKYSRTTITDAFVSDAVASLHQDIGYTLMSKWGIHESYCKVAKFHNSDDFDTGDALLMVVRIANQACRNVGVNTTHERQTDLYFLREVQILNIKESVLTGLEAVIESANNFS